MTVLQTVSLFEAGDGPPDIERKVNDLLDGTPVLSRAEVEIRHGDGVPHWVLASVVLAVSGRYGIVRIDGEVVG